MDVSALPSVCQYDVVTTGTVLFLIFALGAAFCFEFINGFHDTANAVATVIYTKSLKAPVAVFLSGVFNFLGVLLGGTAVAFTIVHLLPLDMILGVNAAESMSMILALLIAAIIWNIATWYKGLPVSSSHTLIGSIIGVALTGALIKGAHYGNAVTQKKTVEVFFGLLLSPLVGFALATIFMYIFKSLMKKDKHNELFEAPDGEKPPPAPIRIPTIISSFAVSFTHGSNDGQKGIGIIMLILISVMPGFFAINLDSDKQAIDKMVASISKIESIVSAQQERQRQEIAANSQKPAADKKAVPAAPAKPATNGKDQKPPAAASTSSDSKIEDSIKKMALPAILRIDASPILERLAWLKSELKDKADFSGVNKKTAVHLRSEILLVDNALEELAAIGTNLYTKSELKTIKAARKDMRSACEYTPAWVIVGVALALGCGTMIGWRRVVETIGKKIGKTHMTYMQGMTAQTVAACTIFLGNICSLPISTTHTLSSAVAGSMTASKSGGLHGKKVRSIALAWIFTFPASMILSGLIFAIIKLVFLK